MRMFNRRLMAALLLAVAAVLGAVCLSGCAKKLRQEAAPASAAVVTPEALLEVSVTFTDARDGKTYRTVKMPDGKTWMAQNLNYAPEEGESWCYEDEEANCEKYGRLYDWETAVEACPAGWHLPSREEWDALVTYAGDDVAGTKLKSATGWNEDDDVNGNGTDDFGFSALPGGYRRSGGNFYRAGNYGFWWTATEARGRLRVRPGHVLQLRLRGRALRRRELRFFCSLCWGLKRGAAGEANRIPPLLGA